MDAGRGGGGVNLVSKPGGGQEPGLPDQRTLGAGGGIRTRDLAITSPSRHVTAGVLLWRTCPGAAVSVVY